KLRHLLDNFMKNIRAVEALKANNWDQLVIYMLSEKLDSDTRKTWEMSADAKKDDLTLDKMKDFLQLHCQALESAAGTRNKDRTVTSNHQDHRRAKAHLVTVPPAPTHVHKCQVCSGNHPMYRCEQFLKLTAVEREALVRSKHSCFNCLSPSHQSKDCNSKHHCKKCNKRHNTLLHQDVIAQTAQLNPMAPSFATFCNF